MATTVFVDDYVNGERYYVTMGETELGRVEDNWDNQDRLLVDLSHTRFFDGKTRWSELRPVHYKVLILRNFVHMDNIKPAQRLDPSNPVVKSLYFLIGAFVKCLSDRADTHVEFLKIQRFTPDQINFDYHASLILELEAAPSQERGLKVVVDNTRE
jgi:hypothetical protein